MRFFKRSGQLEVGFIILTIYQSSFRLNHRLPCHQTHPEVMQRTADFHDQVADGRRPKAAGVMDHAAALDAAIDVLNTHAAACDAPMGGFWAAREGSASWRAGRHEALDRVERARLEAQILEPSTARGSGRGGGSRQPLIVGTPRLSLTQEEDGAHGVAQPHSFDRVARVLAAITARLRRRILGPPATSCGPIRRNRGEAGGWAGAAAGGSDALGGACADPTRALTSAAVTPRRVARSVKDRVGASPSARRVPCRTTSRPWIPG